MSLLSIDILRTRRQYFVDKVKAPLMKALVILAGRYPEPTKENTDKHNTHVLLDIWDEFFKHEDNPGRDGLFKAIRKITIAEYEHDGYYSQRIDWFLKKLAQAYVDGEWEPPKSWNPSCWRSDERE